MNHSSIDYEDVGLICGLEVHQQLLTERKMFCHCPAGLYTKTHDGSVLRHMRPTLSELGEYDGTALMEFKTKKNIVYLLHASNVCTYEMDDTPPFLVNQQALDIAIEQCLMLGCDIVDEVHIARKQYLDGSIPTGFQRTAIVGVNGKLPFRGRELSITQISMEEDSCREVSDNGHLIVWRTDRLGMPLIETVTGPDLRTPEEVEEAILLVGRVCRSTGHVRTGMGASRQDVNVSVRGGRRVEIKGVPKASWAPRLVHSEAVRQVNLLKLRDELHQRGFSDRQAINMDHRDVTHFFANGNFDLLKVASFNQFLQSEERHPDFEQGRGPFTVRLVRLPGLAGTLNWPTQPGETFAHELKGRIRVIAALDQQPILLHSEKWPDYHGSTGDLRRLTRKLRCTADDAIVIVWGAEEDTIMAAQEILLRYQDAVEGVPNETRQPFEDGSTDFERILPGPDRMYPDTDSPPNAIKRERVQRLRDALPENPWSREERYVAAGVPVSTIHFLIRRNGAATVDDVVQFAGADLRQAAFFFGEKLKGLQRKGVPVDTIPIERWREFFESMTLHPVLWEAWKRIVAWLASNPTTSLESILDESGLGQPPSDWRAAISQLVADKKPDHADGSSEQRLRFFIGLAMENLRGKVLARDVVEHIKAEMEVGR